MDDKKISELANITGADVNDANDKLVIVDTSTSESRTITRGELFKDVDGNITLSGTVDGRDVAADGSKLDGIETNADVTDTANVTAAGALMDSELTSEASVKGLDQGVATTDSPDFAGLTVDTDTLYVDSTNNRVGIGTSSPSSTLDVTGTVTADGLNISSTDFKSITQTHTDGNTLTFTQSGTGGDIEWRNANGSAVIRTASASRLRVGSTGDISFYEHTGTTPKFFWDASAESLGIGTSSPAEKLHVDGSGEYVLVTPVNYASNQNSAYLVAAASDQYGSGAGNWGDVGYQHRLKSNSSGVSRLTIDTPGSGESFSIVSNGNVGIGTSSPGSRLSVVGLPTSSAGLSAGDIYIDAGTLKIVT